jgi:hypothetical protein
MFICQKCGCQTEPGQKQITVITQTRPRTYFNDNGTTSHGSEIMREIKVCSEECAVAE